MAGLIDFSQIFTDDVCPTQSSHGAAFKARNKDVPEAPVFKDIPDLDVIFTGDAGPARMQLSQWLPSTQMSQRNKHSDSDDIYLGSQFPVVHKIGPSQIPHNARETVHIAPSYDDWTSQHYNGSLNAGYSQQYTYGKHSLTNPRPKNAHQNLNKQHQQDQGPHAKRLTSGTQGVHTQVTKSVEPVPANSQEDLFDESLPAHSPDLGVVYTPGPNVVPAQVQRFGVPLRSVTEISENFRGIFKFRHFNIVQSKVFDDVMYGDRSLVLCAPTGSGKTAVFEMAMVRILSAPTAGSTSYRNIKIVYMAPIKALCSERYTDWKGKLEPHGLKVMELTGDTDMEDFYELQEVNIILTTPEKWDSMTRKWRENKSVVQSICLFLIDEIHVLNDPTRGSVVEAVVSRMKTIEAAQTRGSTNLGYAGLRFIAASATITNIEDIAEWLGKSGLPAVHYKLDDSVRPVRLRKVVLGYNFQETKQSMFQFDISLSYKLASVINSYSENKPSLVFCATRKSAMQGAEILAKAVQGTLLHDGRHRLELQNFSMKLKDAKLRDLVSKGIGYHHAGMDMQDRKAIEEVFASGNLPVLVATSTLAMGVNLPAHLVVVKSTMFYNMGSHEEYPDSQVLQMIGRAGRPQFDNTATAVIMTRNQTKMKYEHLLNGTQVIESSLHRNLMEHLNAEIALATISDISVALEWLKYTFLYIRVMKNPGHYGLPIGLSRNSIEKRLQDMCMRDLNQLKSLQLIFTNEETMDVRSTDIGKLVARYCISCKTAELFMAIIGTETVNQLLEIMCKCEEFSDIMLRNNEKKTLNTLNRHKNMITIRYPMTGKIRTTDMKVNCLIQAALGSLGLQDFALQQDTSRIFRAGIRVSRCLVELLWHRPDFKSFLSALQLCKGFRAKLWEDSKYVSKQLDGIGPALSTALVNAGLTTFDKLKETNPREIELIVNRHPPFGNQIRESIAKLPKYELSIQQVARYCSSSAEIVITVELTNQDLLRDLGCNTNHMCTLVVGDEDNMTVYKQRIMDALLMKEKSWSKRLEVRRAVKGAELFIHYISQEWVGLDIECTYTPHYLGEQTMSNHMETLSDRLEDMGDLVPCHHQCRNKRTCNHPCCKHGVPSKRHASNNSQKGILAKARPTSSNAVTSHVQNLEKWVEKMPPTPRLANRIRPNYNNGMDHPDLSRFAYTPAKITGDKLGRNNNSGCTPESGQHFSNHFNQAPTTSNVNLVKRKTDWADLDMYIKYRQNQSFNDNEINNNISDEDSLPDIDGANQDMTYTGLDTGQDKWTDDFEQETDYGYRYVHDVTDSEIPAEWDERLNTHMQQISTIAKRKKASSVARRPKKLHTDLDQPQNNLPTCGQPLYVATPLYGSTNASKATSGPKSPKMVESHPSMTRQHDPVCGYKANLHGDDQVDNPHDTSLYDIEDFSTDESFEDCCPSDSSNTAHESNVSNTGLAPSRFVYQYSGPNLTGNNVKVPSRNTANLPADCNDNRRSSSFQNGLKHQSSIHPNQSKPTGSILKRTPFHNHTDSTLKENSGPKINTMVFENDDSCDEMFHDGIAGSRQSASKWTNFFSSQSSTASDRMNLEYPAMHGHNQLVMERHGGSRKQESEDNKETPKGSVTDKSTATCSSHIGTKRHNYGQVLAWVSNPANHPGASRSAPSENKSDTRGCAGNSDSTTSAKHIAERPKSQNLNLLFTKNPVKQTGAFSNIFEGLF